jgi:hypothetical protein
VKYLLRDIPDPLWVRVKRRAAKDGHTLRWVVLALLKYYADHGLPVSDTKAS